jgi:hypothetical protein
LLDAPDRRDAFVSSFTTKVSPLIFAIETLFLPILPCKAANMDRESIYTLSIGLAPSTVGDDSKAPSEIQKQLIQFILEFRIDNQFIYR